jgi:hypothetical protein
VRPLDVAKFLGQRQVDRRIVEAAPHQSPALLGVVGGDDGLRRDAGCLADGGDVHAPPVVAAPLPAVVRTDDPVAFDVPVRERCAAVCAPIGSDPRLVAVGEVHDEPLAEQIYSLRLVQLVDPCDREPRAPKGTFDLDVRRRVRIHRRRMVAAAYGWRAAGYFEE